MLWWFLFIVFLCYFGFDDDLHLCRATVRFLWRAVMENPRRTFIVIFATVCVGFAAGKAWHTVSDASELTNAFVGLERASEAGAEVVPRERIWPLDSWLDFMGRCESTLKETDDHCMALLPHAENRYTHEQYGTIVDGFGSDRSTQPPAFVELEKSFDG